jgi:hypothetical protein
LADDLKEAPDAENRTAQEGSVEEARGQEGQIQQERWQVEAREAIRRRGQAVCRGSV